jgi:integrase
MTYYVDGKQIWESTRTKDKAEAQKILQSKIGQIADGRYAGPAADRTTFEDLAEMFLTDYKVNGKKTLQDAEIRVQKHLAPFFRGWKAQQITAADVHAYITHRREQGAQNATINRELAALKRAFNLAMRAEKIVQRPYIPALAENNVRQGFFEQLKFEAVPARLPDYLRPPVMFAYQVGWRIRSEVLPLTWVQVDLEEGTVRLEVGSTKNTEGRLVYLPAFLLDVLEAQWREHLAHYPDCPFIFHNRGKQIFSFYKAWRRSCREAGVEAKIPHDFRRTAIRNMVRAGIPERVAMQIARHKTREVFDRYHIVSSGDLREAARKLSEQFLAQTMTKTMIINLPAQEQSALTH